MFVDHRAASGKRNPIRRTFVIDGRSVDRARRVRERVDGASSRVIFDIFSRLERKARAFVRFSERIDAAVAVVVAAVLAAQVPGLFEAG